VTIKIRTSTEVTELTRNNGEWRIKRNGAKVDEDKLKAIIEVMKVGD
jgi:stress response protein SCP2